MEFKVVAPDEGNDEASIDASGWPEETRPTMVLGFADNGQVVQVSDGTWTYHQLAKALSQLLEVVLREAATAGEL